MTGEAKNFINMKHNQWRKSLALENVDSFDSLTLDGEEKEQIDDSTKETKDDQVEIIESSTQGQSKELSKEWRTTKGSPSQQRH
ncbi:hypothetical protein PIB30_111653, partial [Stylosanthes scabra]|nr:hypothetical protein [Stylosanthes scabra]